MPFMLAKDGGVEHQAGIDRFAKQKSLLDYDQLAHQNLTVVGLTCVPITWKMLTKRLNTDLD